MRKLPERQAAACALETSDPKGNMPRRHAILTIDDSPSRITGEFAAYLVSRNIDAVFFCIGNKLLEFPETADLLVRSGFTIGNHSLNHPRFSELTLPECEHQVAETERIIEAVHERNGIPRKAKLFRFPYGDKGGAQRPAIQEILARYGFRSLQNLSITYPWYSAHSLDTDRDAFWTFDALDYRLGSKTAPIAMRDLHAHLESASPSSGGILNGGASDEILLMHDHETTAALHPRYYEEIIERIEGFGIEFQRAVSLLPREVGALVQPVVARSGIVPWIARQARH